MGIQYENAPITESLIDIRVAVLPSSKMPALEAIHESVKEHYPEKKECYQFEARFSLGAEVGATAHNAPMGYSFQTKDGKQIFQARLDGFTFNRLRPYGNWIELRDQARKLWGIYRAAIGPRKIIRVAVRYINPIDISVHAASDAATGFWRDANSDADYGCSPCARHEFCYS